MSVWMLLHLSLHTCFIWDLVPLFLHIFTVLVYCVSVHMELFFILSEGLSTENTVCCADRTVKCLICDTGLFQRSIPSKQGTAQTRAAALDAEAGVNPLCHR